MRRLKKFKPGNLVARKSNSYQSHIIWDRLPDSDLPQKLGQLPTKFIGIVIDVGSNVSMNFEPWIRVITDVGVVGWVNGYDLKIVRV